MEDPSLPCTCRLVYEWQKLDEKTKQPIAISMKGDGMFALAGICETWKDKTTGKSCERTPF
jgi:putative SOS response-associated peptidase YedK